MSAMAEKARERAKAKVGRMTTADPHQKVDASGWTPPEAMHANVKTGMRPISRRAYRAGGKVHGEKAKMHAGRKPRKSGGMTADDFVNRNVKSANSERDGEKFIGGLKRGGRAHKDMGGEMALPAAFDATTRKAGGRTGKMMGGSMQMPMRRTSTPMGARVGNGAPTATGHPIVQMRKSGGKVHEKKCRCEKCGGGGAYAKGGATNASESGTRPEGGRIARKSGGRTKKGAMNVNIIIAGQGNKPAMPMPPPGAGAPPPGGPIGLHQGAPPMAPPGAAPAGGPPMMARKSGGRTTYPIKDGAGGGEGRLQKARAYG